MVADDKSLVWPATQADVKNITNVPMTASSSVATGDVNFAFKHLGSVLQLVLTAKNGTINVKQIDITADQGLSGAFTVESGAAKISNTGTTITTGDISAKNIKLSATASYLNFAVPSGDFTNFKIIITDVNDKEYSLSAASLTLQRAMVNKVTFAMDAKDSAVFEVNVNGHTVTVKLAEDTPESEVLSGGHIEDDSVIIEFYSKLKHGLWCSTDDNAVVPVTSKSNGFFTFALSDISKDMVVTVGYINVSFDLNNSGMNAKFTVKPDDITKIGYNATIKEPTRPFSDKYGFRGWYKDKACTQKWDYSYGVTESRTLYAKWKEDPAGSQINGHNFVKLAGYYWATDNVGEVKDQDQNNLYVAYHPIYGYYYNQAKALKAAQSWGSPWTLPSEAQFQNLITYCDWEWRTNYNGTQMNGHLVTGREGHYESGNSIFLPACGYYNPEFEIFGPIDTHGLYFSITNGRILQFEYNYAVVYSRDMVDEGKPVRPVLAE